MPGLRIALMAGALSLSPLAVHAQSPAQTAPIATQLEGIGSRCSEQPANAHPAVVLTVCRNALFELSRISMTNSLSGHENHVFWTMNALIHATIGLQVGVMDGGPSQPFCEQMEAAWSDYSHVTPASSPPDYAASMETMRRKAAGTVKSCRGRFAPPFGAPDLPAE